MTRKILIIDDDIKLIHLLKEYLEENRFAVSHALEGDHAVDEIKEKTPDLIILDIMLPGKDGLEVLKDIRKVYTLPVIMLTAKGDDTDRIIGLELGADDYLPKPFNPRELLARIKAILRRQDILTAEDPGDNLLIRCNDMVLNRAAHTIEVRKKTIDLSTTEFNILEVLMKSPNTVLSRDQIMNLSQGKDFMVFDRSIDIHISKLRAKIESDPGSPKRIKTIWGTGYMFVDSP
ncbi:MAG: response regulator [Proteobacteria bacterium]|nr:response regulator [Desulfobacula sp.]MBU3954735.1 response regulator [Pseudomonadota bacterium]MBU4132534.1 response regulator [Pseudomonadota bacterium]